MGEKCGDPGSARPRDAGRARSQGWGFRLGGSMALCRDSSRCVEHQAHFESALSRCPAGVLGVEFGSQQPAPGGDVELAHWSDKETEVPSAHTRKLWRQTGNQGRSFNHCGLRPARLQAGDRASLKCFPSLPRSSLSDVCAPLQPLERPLPAGGWDVCVHTPLAAGAEGTRGHPTGGALSASGVTLGECPSQPPKLGVATATIAFIQAHPSGSLAGGVILGVALWLRHDPQTTNLLYLELGDRPAPNTFYVGIYILIAVGAVMMFVGFLGCYGAIQESQCLLGTFFTCLVILYFVLSAKEDGVQGSLRSTAKWEEGAEWAPWAPFSPWREPAQLPAPTPGRRSSWGHVSRAEGGRPPSLQLNCCGSNALTTVTTSVFKNSLCPSSGNVISNLLKEDCHGKIDELFSGKLYLIGIAAIVVAVIMIFEMILSMVLCCGIRSSSVY
ncbi:CD81 antigen [Neophocaena asiaeorientalis asiaeorientalis]|uniref:CD81 antigen n=1 Tax=Neophocaena asiaeorientalis asiaeorientalis TaxID=1706337 RepID=A0A341BQP0_NEOAA|nr:CD81 antigen [Neophocaena asiaeorientalis asiaeorientalis]